MPRHISAGLCQMGWFSSEEAVLSIIALSVRGREGVGDFYYAIMSLSLSNRYEYLCWNLQFHKRTKIEVWDIKLPVISLENLISMKKKANRKKDIEDVKALLELKNLWKRKDHCRQRTTWNGANTALRNQSWNGLLPRCSLLLLRKGRLTLRGGSAFVWKIEEIQISCP